MNKPLGKQPTSITGTRKYTSNRRGLVGVGIREKVKPLLTDEELAAQADFIRKCREGRYRPAEESEESWPAPTFSTGCSSTSAGIRASGTRSNDPIRSCGVGCGTRACTGCRRDGETDEARNGE